MTTVLDFVSAKLEQEYLRNGGPTPEVRCIILALTNSGYSLDEIRYEVSDTLGYLVFRDRLDEALRILFETE